MFPVLGLQRKEYSDMSKKNTEETALQKFFRENKSLTYMIPLLVILIIVAVIINVSSGNDKKTVKTDSKAKPSETSTQIDTNQPQVDVLPQIIRSDNTEAVEQQKDPFESPMKLTGIVYSSLKSTAIIEWGGYSYIIELNDIVGNSKWKVTRIEKDSITLDNGSESIVLVLTEKSDS